MAKIFLILIITFFDFLNQTIAEEIYGIPKIVDGDTVHINKKK